MRPALRSLVDRRRVQGLAAAATHSRLEARPRRHALGLLSDARGLLRRPPRSRASLRRRTLRLRPSWRPSCPAPPRRAPTPTPRRPRAQARFGSCRTARPTACTRRRGRRTTTRRSCRTSTTSSPRPSSFRPPSSATPTATGSTVPAAGRKTSRHARQKARPPPTAGAALSRGERVGPTPWAAATASQSSRCAHLAARPPHRPPAE